MSTRSSGPSDHDPRPPRSLVSRPEEDAQADAERLRQAVAALERVRTQLARTQRTLDAFVSQITGTPDGALTLSPAPARADRPDEQQAADASARPGPAPTAQPHAAPAARQGAPAPAQPGTDVPAPPSAGEHSPSGAGAGTPSRRTPDALAGHVLPPAGRRPPSDGSALPGAPEDAADRPPAAPRPAPPVALTDHVRSADDDAAGPAGGRALPPGPP